MSQDFANAYADRLKSAAEAADLIPSGSKVAMAIGAGQPPALLKAFAERAKAGQVEDINLYYLLSTGIAGDTVLQPELNDRIRPYSLFHSAIERNLEKLGAQEGRQRVWYIPSSFQQAPAVMINAGVDTLLATVSPMDDEGYFTFGTNPDYAVPLSKVVERVILEVNANMPRVYGNTRVHISDVTALVENDVDVLEAGKAPQAPQDIAIGQIIAGMIEDGSTIQMGIGGLPDAVCAALKNHKDLGFHTELLTPGLVDLMRAGVITNAKKNFMPGKGVFAFSLGQRETYDFIHENPDLEGHPVDFVNDPSVIAKNDKMVSVNATLQIDLFGACCSEFLNGKQFTAAGGQLDFVRGASASKGGKSIIACHSTAAKGTVSRIVARLDGPATVARNDIHYVVTEHGVAELRGKTVGERARALIAVADPAFRDDLSRQARELGLI